GNSTIEKLFSVKVSDSFEVALDLEVITQEIIVCYPVHLSHNSTSMTVATMQLKFLATDCVSYSIAQFKIGYRMLRVVVFVSLSSPSCPLLLASREYKQERMKTVGHLQDLLQMQGQIDGSVKDISPACSIISRFYRVLAILFIPSPLLHLLNFPTLMAHRKLLQRALSMNSIWNYKLEGKV
ncbi:MAG: hypothetical protein EZS28_053363, partial [Streblomastix strix]